MLLRLRRHTPQVPVVVARAEQLPFAAGVFDLACCATGWHWVEVAAAVEQIRPVVRPGGLLALWWANQARDDSIDWERAEGEVHERWKLRVAAGRPQRGRRSQ